MSISLANKYNRLVKCSSIASKAAMAFGAATGVAAIGGYFLGGHYEPVKFLGLATLVSLAVTDITQRRSTPLGLKLLTSGVNGHNGPL